MAFTQTQLDALNEAIASGTLTVTYADKTVTYRSLNDMLRIQKLMQASINPSGKEVRRKYAEYSKGIDEQLR